MAAKKTIQQYFDLLTSLRFSDTTNCESERIHFVITDGVNDAVIGTAGSYVVFSGLPKAGKSTYLGAIIASAISNKVVFNFKLFTYPGLKGRIALFDTEQSNYDFKRTINRIKKLSGVRDIYKNFDAFTVREQYTSDILKLIYSYLVSTPKCGILIIDGLMDLVDNFNDERESKKVVKYLRLWSKKFDCLIITVLHLGKSDKSSLGHLGSFAERYSQSTLLIEKTKQQTITCTPKLLRSAGDFTPIEILYDPGLKDYRQI